MIKYRIRLALPLLLIAGMLAHGWWNLIASAQSPGWKHYLGLSLFIVILIAYALDYGKSVVYTLIFLLLGTFDLLSFRAEAAPPINFTQNADNEMSAPPVNIVCLALLVLTFILNMDVLIKMFKGPGGNGE